MTLDPLRRALLEDVRIEGQEGERRQRAAAEQRLRDARTAAEQLVSSGREAGERAAAREAARTRSAAVRRAREARLRAERHLLDLLHARALAAAFALREERGYDTLLDRLAETARAQLGPEAEFVRDPPGRGGVIARAGARSVDYTLSTLVDRAIGRIGDRLEELWR